MLAGQFLNGKLAVVLKSPIDQLVTLCLIFRQISKNQRKSQLWIRQSLFFNGVIHYFGGLRQSVQVAKCIDDLLTLLGCEFDRRSDHAQNAESEIPVSALGLATGFGIAPGAVSRWLRAGRVTLLPEIDLRAHRPSFGA
jgi:hypothetical protein